MDRSRRDSLPPWYVEDLGAFVLCKHGSAIATSGIRETPRGAKN
jgi:hypothetical protein